jgi:uncharacterized protein YfdQ (DUF2303 family)
LNLTDKQRQALLIVLNLAEGNAVTEQMADEDEMLLETKEKQEEAFTVVHNMIHAE